jgi:hypothetical protein
VFLETIGIGSIIITIELDMVMGLGNKWQGRVSGDTFKWDVMKSQGRLGLPVDYAPVNGVTKICNTFELSVMYFGRSNCKF